MDDGFPVNVGNRSPRGHHLKDAFDIRNVITSRNALWTLRVKTPKGFLIGSLNGQSITFIQHLATFTLSDHCIFKSRFRVHRYLSAFDPQPRHSPAYLVPSCWPVITGVPQPMH